MWKENLKYLNAVCKKYTVYKVIEYTIILITLVAAIDEVDIIRKYDCNLTKIILAGIAGVILIKFFKYGFSEVFTLNIINKVDLYIIVLLNFSIVYLSGGIIIDIASAHIYDLISMFKDASLINTIVLYSLIFIFKAFSIPLMILCLTLQCIKEYYFTYKVRLLIFLLVIGICMLLHRSYNYKKNNQAVKVIKEKKNVFTIQDIYRDEFDKNHKKILIEDKEADYDLLGRDYTIEKIYNLLIECNPDQHFVISLEGKWGSGKSTILKKVKDKLNDNNELIIIDSFNPWIYGNEENMLYNMLDSLFQSTGHKYKPSKIKRITNSIYNAVSTKYKDIGLIKSMIFNDYSMLELQRDINEYLNSSNKKFVFIIDNIERAENKNIILLFKLISNVLNFNRVVYVLAFDNEQIKKIFEKDLNMDYDYLNKIIQARVMMPVINRSKKNELMMTSINNILNAYGESPETIEYIRPVLEIIFELIDDMREFDKFINSVISNIFEKNREKYLDEKDMLIVQYFKIFNYDIYKEIYNHKEYYLNHKDGMSYIKEHKAINGNDYVNHKKRYFEKLYQNTDMYTKSLLKLISDIDGKIEENDDDDLKVSMASSKYFDLFFNEGENEALITSKKVKILIDELEYENNEEQYINIINNFINNNEIENYKNLLEEFNKYIDEFDCVQSKIIFYVLWEKVKYLLYLDDVFYIIHTMSALLIRFSYEDFIEFSNKIKYTDKINCRLLIRILENYRRIVYAGYCEDEQLLKKKEKLLVKALKKVRRDIIYKNINIYDDKYYFWGKVDVFLIGKYEINPDKNDSDRIRDYMASILSKENVFKFLLDVIIKGFNSKGTYRIDLSMFNSLITIDEVDAVLKNINKNNITKYEKELIGIYEKMSNYFKKHSEKSGYFHEDFETKSLELSRYIENKTKEYNEMQCVVTETK